MPASKAQREATAHRRRQAVAMRQAGVDYETIADRLGYGTRQAAHRDVARALELSAAEYRHDLEVLRQQEVARLDRLQAALWAAAVGGARDVTETVLKIVDRRVRLLGLDAPQRHEVVTMGAVEAEIARLSAMLGDDQEAGEVVPSGRSAGRSVGGPEAGAAP